MGSRPCPHPRHPVQAAAVSSKSLCTVCLPQQRKKTAEKEKRRFCQRQDNTGDMNTDREKRNIQKHAILQQRSQPKTGKAHPPAQRPDGLTCPAPHLHRRAKPTCATVKSSALFQRPQEVIAQNMLLLTCRSRGGSW